MMPGMTLAARTQDAMRHHAAIGRVAVPSGPFTVYVAEHTDAPHASYAIPGARARAGAGDVQALRDVFARHGRTPRLEYVHEESPALLADLMACAFAVELDTPVMVVRPDALQAPPAPDGVTLQRVDATAGGDTLREILTVGRAAFGAPPPTADDVARLPTLLGDGLAVLARSAGRPVGVGQFTPPAGGVTEVVGIGVLEDERGRGIAAALTAELARQAFRRGVEIALLTPGDAGARRVYERAGFRSELRMLHLRG